jgi:hypothetical protein
LSSLVVQTAVLACYGTEGREFESLRARYDPPANPWWDVQARQQDQRLHACRVHSGLLHRLADRGCRRPCVAILTRAAGKRDLAGMVAEVECPLQQQYVRPAVTVGRDQDQDRCLALGGGVSYEIIAAQPVRAGRGNGMDKARERRRHDGWRKIRYCQPACAIVDQRALHIQKSDALRRDNAVLGRRSATTAYRKHCGAKVRTCTVVTSGLHSRRSMIGSRSASSVTTVLCS